MCVNYEKYDMKKKGQDFRRCKINVIIGQITTFHHWRCHSLIKNQIFFLGGGAPKILLPICL